MVPFAGFDMPVQYSSILKEHDAVRHRAGLFDLSHMGQFFLDGDMVARWADTLTTNNVGTMKPMQARYNLFCNEGGGTHDDTIFYRLEHRWMLVVNAGNADKMWQHLNAHLPTTGVELENWHGKRALIAVQGPKSIDVLQMHVDVDLAALKYYFCAEGLVEGVPATIARTGYTGEDGFELFVRGEDAPRIWNVLLEEHRSDGLEPCGLGARDVLRLEAGMPLYGHELTEAITPVQAGLKWAVKTSKPEFIGKGALEDQIAQTATRGLPVSSWRVVRRHARDTRVLARQASLSGAVCSGSIGPSVGNKNIATALLSRRSRRTGDAVRGRDSRNETSHNGRTAAVLQTAAMRKERNVGAA